jgi:hypothetical protein
MPAKKSPLTDRDNDPVFTEVAPDQPEGMSVEDAYRHLAGLPPKPVEVEDES